DGLHAHLLPGPAQLGNPRARVPTLRARASPGWHGARYLVKTSPRRDGGHGRDIMQRKLIPPAVALLALAGATVILPRPVGASDRATQAADQNAQAGAAAPAAATSQDDAVEADNTGRNVRDRDGRTRTPIDQSNEPGDLA